MPECWIPGEPIGKGRPRMTTVGGSARAYTPAKTRNAEAHVAACWTHPMFEKGRALTLKLSILHKRPATHLLRHGELSAEGLRHPYPVKRPDIDNIVKLVLDGLNGVAFHDDVQILRMVVERSWAPFGNPGISVTIEPVQG